MQSFLIIMAAFALYSLLHSLLASLGFKARLEARLGAAWMQRWYRLVFNIIGTLTLLPIFYLLAVLPNRQLYTVPMPWAIINYALQLFGLWILFDSVRRTGALEFLGLRQAAGGRGEHGFIRAGYYRWVRHPLYSGAMLFLWASPSMSWLLLAFYLSISLYFIVGAVYEERKLRRLFGEEYARYAAEVPPFLPRLGRLHSSN